MSKERGAEVVRLRTPPRNIWTDLMSDLQVMSLMTLLHPCARLVMDVAVPVGIRRVQSGV